MLVSDYNYDLPEERIAKFPPKERGSTRLLVLDRQTGAIKDSYYRNLDKYLNPGDVLILNDTRVMQSRLFCELPDGRQRELVVLEKHGPEPQRVMYRGKLHEGESLTVLDRSFVKSEGFRSAAAREGAREPRGRMPKESSEERTSSFFRDDDWQATLVDGRERRDPRINKASVLIRHILGNGIAEVESSIPLAELAEKYGTVPLPPYLHRSATADDKERYQTVWASQVGSAAAPTASLNMTEDLLERLRQKGVIIKYLTLHVGLGTFLPIRSDKVEDHQMHSEWFYIPEDTIEAINIARAWAGDGLGRVPAELLRREAPKEDAAGGKSPAGPAQHPRIIALGTTVARTLEYYAQTGQKSGEDDIFIYPSYEFKLVDALITNYHAPGSTVLMLASAFAGWDHLKHAYDHAIAEKYNFLSYGDSMLIC